MSNWTSHQEKLADFNGCRFQLAVDARPASVADVLHGWQTDEQFRTWFNSLLADVSYSAFRWETPSVTTATLAFPFEFVVLDSPGLDRQPEPEVFADHFKDAAAKVVSFANLSGDCVLVVPYPLAKPSAYGHLAAFVRRAPAEQQQALWQMVGESMTQRVGTRPIWLSTAGAGVSWLHIRLDNRPKYYGYDPYREATALASHLHELEQRIASADANPKAGESWESVYTRLSRKP